MVYGTLDLSSENLFYQMCTLIYLIVMILWDVTTDQKFSISLAMPYSTHIFSIISTENRASLYVS